MQDLFFGKKLIAWYRQNGRELPWRETCDPYLIWISEIILQQTRVAQGLDYFLRFTGRFPDVRTLAEAAEEEVLKYWQGLGYYSRARNLHVAAKDIMQRFNGKFPGVYEEILSLKGIGEYTAAAICSSAWNQPYAVLDGNVFRVLSRIFEIDLPIDSTEGKKYFSQLSTELLDKKNASLYNQAIMDFGALQCTPKSPDCTVCPINEKCKGYHSGRVQEFPVKKGKTKTIPRYFNYFDIRHQGKRLISQRIQKDIWQNLFEFPLIETSRSMEWEELAETGAFRELFAKTGIIKVLPFGKTIKHVLSHRIIFARFYQIEVEMLSEKMKAYKFVSNSEFEKFAISRLIQMYLENV